jgi:two-component system chemotaxis response regulator CheY
MGPRILIVDDAVFMRMMLTDFFVENGYEVVGKADNAKEANRLYTELMPDLVTMDIVMPGGDGIETVREIMKIDRKAKILVVSALGQEEGLVKEAIEAGAKGFMVKPFKLETIIAEVERILHGGENSGRCDDRE